jgi:hypothetical protein
MSADALTTSRFSTALKLPGSLSSWELMAYGARISGLVHSSANYMDSIFKDARPGSVPVEGPAKFDLAIDLRMGKTFGLTIPPSLGERM